MSTLKTLRGCHACTFFHPLGGCDEKAHVPCGVVCNAIRADSVRQGALAGLLALHSYATVWLCSRVCAHGRGIVCVRIPAPVVTSSAHPSPSCFRYAYRVCVFVSVCPCVCVCGNTCVCVDVCVCDISILECNTCAFVRARICVFGCLCMTVCIHFPCRYVKATICPSDISACTSCVVS